MIESILLTATSVLTFVGTRSLTNASGFFFERATTAALLRKLGAKSEGAVTLEGFIKKQTGQTPNRNREFGEKPEEKKPDEKK